MLSERLRSLEAEGLVTRTVVPESPVRVEYELTGKGRELQDALHEIASWAERWIPLDDEEVEAEKPPQPQRVERRTRKVKHA
jgi:DNA-binding HxlR family transcriptional regulator